MIEINIFNKALNLKIEDSKVRELVHLTLNEIHYEKINLNFIFCNDQTLNDFKVKYFVNFALSYLYI